MPRNRPRPPPRDRVTTTSLHAAPDRSIAPFSVSRRQFSMIHQRIVILAGGLKGVVTERTRRRGSFVAEDVGQMGLFRGQAGYLGQSSSGHPTKSLGSRPPSRSTPENNSPSFPFQSFSRRLFFPRKNTSRSFLSLSLSGIPKTEFIAAVAEYQSKPVRSERRVEKRASSY